LAGTLPVTNPFHRFRRITSSDHYLPEVDGLRFMALLLVIVQMHIPHYIDEKFFGNHLFKSTYWYNFILEGRNGVYLFFVISGFILSLPFARNRFQNGPQPSVKRYYLRRLSRLEPPYLIALSLCFVAQVWLLHSYSFKELLPHFGASVLYLHNIIYDRFSDVMPVAWTLEVEVQFYIIAPLLCLVFRLRRWQMRLMVYMLACGLPMVYGASLYFTGHWHGIAHVFHLSNLFVGGMALADGYVHRVQLIPHKRAGAAAAVVAGLLFIFLLARLSAVAFFAKYFAMMLFVHLALTNDYVKKALSLRGITLIGGMCYSIYLIHFAVLSFTGSLLLRTGLNLGQVWLVPVITIFFSTIILAASAVFFYYIEKPFMKLRVKHWS
jgi:peptidoglycan/LPS O-acetylase OafA/YrhL